MDPTSRRSYGIDKGVIGGVEIVIFKKKLQLQFWQHNWTPGQGGHNYILIYLKILTIDMTQRDGNHRSVLHQHGTWWILFILALGFS